MVPITSTAGAQDGERGPQPTSLGEILPGVTKGEHWGFLPEAETGVQQDWGMQDWQPTETNFRENAS